RVDRADTGLRPAGHSPPAQVQARSALRQAAELLARSQAYRGVVLDQLPRDLGASGGEVLSLARARERWRSDRGLAWPRSALVATVLIAVVAASLVWGVSGLGAWLVV